ncbi:MAG TPA: acyl carrier protein [Holophaga sp.]|nr:acyl carrier protein [Holophaga sp.]
MSSVAEAVVRIVAEVTRRNPGDLGAETRLAEDLMIKSINRIELAAILEEEVKVPISSFDILKPRTIGDIVAMIAAKQR